MLEVAGRTQKGLHRQRENGRTTVSYRVVYSRDESGWWQARVPSVKGCHTQGRTIEEARRRIREALDLFVDDASTAELVDDVQLPGDVKIIIKAYTTARRKVENQQVQAYGIARKAVKVLQRGKLKLSARDAAGVLGISHQRVNQLLKDVDASDLERVEHRKAAK